MEIKKYGLIGKNIGYTFSQKFFTEKFKRLSLDEYRYEIFDLKDITEVSKLLNDSQLRGFNVTIPYKQQILPYLDDLSPEAAEIGAVNTVKISNGAAKGYNTDAYGFEETLRLHLKEHHRAALVLGNGGAAKAVQFVLKKMEIPYKTVTRSADLNFHTLSGDMVSDHQIIVQCTPVGTFPYVEDCISFPFNYLTDKHLVIDLIYNPEQTEFMKRAAAQGAQCCNGLRMLHHQAEKAWEIWQS